MRFDLENTIPQAEKTPVPEPIGRQSIPARGLRSINGKSLLAGSITALLVLLAIVIGSRWLRHFDPALVFYAAGTIVAAFAVAYRFAVWSQRPPSRLYFKRGWQLIRQWKLKPSKASKMGAGQARAPEKPMEVFKNLAPGTLGHQVAVNFMAQQFIRHRGAFRWIMHLCLSGGCTLAFAITFPLVFGWIHFEPFADNAEMYRINLFGIGVDSMNVHSFKGWMMFNLLNISAVFVLIGLVMAGFRRATDPGERATQKFFEDILPLLLIFAVTITGLALTVSYKFLAGQGHGLWAVVHMFSVVALLLYIPFGKLFHMFQRTCALCVSLYKKAGHAVPRARCRRCDSPYATQMHVADLKTVLDELGFNYRFDGPQGEVHYQEICPACRRRLLALNQGKTIGR